MSVDTTADKSISDSTGDDKYSPLSPGTYSELINEYKENANKLKEFEKNLDNEVLDKKTNKDYKDLIDQQTYLINQRILNYNSRIGEYDAELEESKELNNRLLELKHNTEKDLNKKGVNYNIQETIDENIKRAQKLASDREVVHKTFRVEGFIGPAEKVTTDDWSKKLNDNEREFINSMELESKNAIKERIALENRMEENMDSCNTNTDKSIKADESDDKHDNNVDIEDGINKKEIESLIKDMEEEYREKSLNNTSDEKKSRK